MTSSIAVSWKRESYWLITIFRSGLPTYVTIEDVKKRWGKGQEDIYLVAQFEKLWGDLTALLQVACEYVIVPSMRDQQLKELAQFDAWLRDDSVDDLTRRCVCAPAAH